jgi:hypothetical protein
MGSAEFLSPVSDRPSTGPRAYPRIMREARPNEQRHARRQRAGQRPDAVRLDPLPLCHPVGLRPHTVGRAGPAWARWSTLRLTDLAQAGPNESYRVGPGADSGPVAAGG